MDCNSDVQIALEKMGKKALNASRVLSLASTEQKNIWLNAMADALDDSVDTLLFENSLDVKMAEQNGLSSAKLERLQLSAPRIHDISAALRHVCTLDDPVGRILSAAKHPNGLKIVKVSVPIGVIGIIYESRPNVTVDAAGLCLKAGNAVILRGGSEAFHSNMKLQQIISDAAEKKGMPSGAVQIIPFTEHEAVNTLIQMDKYVHLIIPRGGERLIRTVVQNATVPVIKHYKGVCSIFLDETCNRKQQLAILENAKCQRPGVCNAMENILIHQKIADEFLPEIWKYLSDKGVAFVGDEEACRIIPEMMKASDDEWSKEYLSLKVAVKVVPDVYSAADFINTYGSGHSDSILTENTANADYFLNFVDSAAVYVNASTRFTDGGEFGMGAEIGISTDKLHARGPMGLNELTSYKYKIYGDGQIR